MMITFDTTCFTRLYLYNMQHSITQTQRQTNSELAFQSVSLLNAHLNYSQHFLYMLEFHTLPQFEHTTINQHGWSQTSLCRHCMHVCVCVCLRDQEYPRAVIQAEGSKSQPSESPNLITQIF